MKEKKKKRLSTLLVLCLVLFLLLAIIFAVHLLLKGGSDHWTEKVNNNLVKEDARGGTVYPEDSVIWFGFPDTDDSSDPNQGSMQKGKKYGTATGQFNKNSKLTEEITHDESSDIIGESQNTEDQIMDEESKSPPDQNPEDNPKNPGTLSKPGGGSSSVPAPQFSFILPQTAYTNTEIKIQPESRYVKSVTWTLSKNGLPVSLSDVLSGTLSEQGGTVKFKETGSFTLIATAQNRRGKTAIYEQTVSIYPVVTASFFLPKTAHTDGSVAINLKTSNLGNNAVAWTIRRDGKSVFLSDVLNGELTSTGGTVQFRSPGKYDLTASIMDELGKRITASGSIIVYPVAEIKLTLPEVTHIDRTIILQAETKETDGLALDYGLTRNGESVEITDYIEGNLSEGSVRFKERGVYALTASVTDTTGRIFSDTVNITAYPVGSAGFYLPEIFHTDKSVIVEAVFDEIESHTAKWSLMSEREKVVFSEVAEGELDNSGGRLRFKQKGNYTLKVEFTDDGGRTYRYQQDFRVYPVPKVSYSLPQYAHTDSDITVKTDTADIDDLTIEWLVDNTFGFQNWSTYVGGRLTNEGGTIRFKRAGLYELVARITDATGRVFLYETGGKCEVLPVLNIGFDLPDLAHTDTTIDLRTHGNNNVLPVEWSITRNGKDLSLSDALLGELNAYGGKITFQSEGEYVLTATMTDYLKRSYSHSESILILPVVQYQFSMPGTIHYGTEFDVLAEDVQNLGTNHVVWELKKNGEEAQYTGLLGDEGGKISIRDIGIFTLNATITDRGGRITRHSENIIVTNTAPDAPEITINQTRTMKEGKFLVNVTASATDPDGDAVTLEYEGTTTDGYYTVGTHSIRVRARDEAGVYSDWTSRTFTITSTAPTVTLSATPTRNAQSGKFLVNISASAADADGDTTTLEWDNKATDNRYPAGTHTIKVRAKDSTGIYSAWVSKTFTITNSPPTTPVINRSPGGNSVAPGTQVTITASSSDPDGDPVTLVWENRNAQTQAYPLGRNLVRVKAVDSTGAESPWAAIVFFVASSNGGGGMTLTGPDSVIMENGLEGATITAYTFTVPPVSGHSGSDFGRVRGYNKLTGQWDQLDYQTTTNGITFTRTLGAGVYTRLEFYYYTNHDCMYNKSNITYSVNYHFE